MALIYGTTSGDVNSKSLWGTNGADLIFGLEGSDMIFGQGGDDTLDAGTGHDTVQGGSGNDTVIVRSTTGVFDGGADWDTIIFSHPGSGVFDLGGGFGRIGSSAQFAMTNFEHITTSGGSDFVTGNGVGNRIVTGAGSDTVSGGGGADTIIGGEGGDILRGDAGNDVIDGGSGADGIVGGAGNDFIVSGTGADTINGGADYDTVSYAGRGSGLYLDLAEMTAQIWNDVDLIWNVERVIGTDHADRFIAGSGRADFEGGLGDDIFTAGEGRNDLRGGDGTDGVVYSGSTGAVRVDLAAGTGSGGYASGDTYSGIEQVWGSQYRDALTGDGKANYLVGEGGGDWISGGGGADTIVGGGGADVMSGGSGADEFFFSTADRSYTDRITDFTRGSDKINLRAVDADESRGGFQKFTDLTHLTDPGRAANFDAGTINVRYTDHVTIVELNASDAAPGGMDAPEYTILLDGDIALTLSDFLL